MNPIPSYRPRPALDRWIRDNDLNHADAGKLFGCSREYVRRMCLPFDDADRKKPGSKLLTVIVRQTHGEVRPGDFYPPVRDILDGVPA